MVSYLADGSGGGVFVLDLSTERVGLNPSIENSKSRDRLQK